MLSARGNQIRACGTPVIAFDISGLTDIVTHQQTGYLAKAFDTEDMAQGIIWVLAQGKYGNLGELARQRAVERFSCPVVAEQYQNVYMQVLHV